MNSPRKTIQGLFRKKPYTVVGRGGWVWGKGFSFALCQGLKEKMCDGGGESSLRWIIFSLKLLIFIQWRLTIVFLSHFFSFSYNGVFLKAFCK